MTRHTWRDVAAPSRHVDVSHVTPRGCQPRHATWQAPQKTPESRIQPPGPLIERTQAKQETRTGQRGAKEAGYLGAYRKAPPASVPESANGKVVSCVEPPRGTPQPRASICEPPVQPGSQATHRFHQAQPHAGGAARQRAALPPSTATRRWLWPGSVPTS